VSVTNQGLHFIRAHELAYLRRLFEPERASVLEIGSGTGYQAKALSEMGFRVSALDVNTSMHRATRVFDVVEYDGAHIPFPDGSFDIIFSSNLLEHIRDLPSFLAETRRVLKPNGYCIHAMPSPAWRLWTLLTGPVDAILLVRSALAPLLVGQKPETTTRALVNGIRWRLLQGRHGERGIALTELWTFSRKWWRARFTENGFDVISDRPMGLLYSGWLLFGTSLSIAAREHLSAYLGSSSNAYVVRPR